MVAMMKGCRDTGPGCTEALQRLWGRREEQPWRSSLGACSLRWARAPRQKDPPHPTLEGGCGGVLRWMHLAGGASVTGSVAPPPAWPHLRLLSRIPPQLNRVPEVLEDPLPAAASLRHRHQAHHGGRDPLRHLRGPAAGRRGGVAAPGRLHPLRGGPEPHPPAAPLGPHDAGEALWPLAGCAGGGLQGPPPLAAAAPSLASSLPHSHPGIIFSPAEWVPPQCRMKWLVVGEAGESSPPEDKALQELPAGFPASGTAACVPWCRIAPQQPRHFRHLQSFPAPVGLLSVTHSPVRMLRLVGVMGGCV